jgi:hypothetical protein
MHNTPTVTRKTAAVLPPVDVTATSSCLTTQLGQIPLVSILCAVAAHAACGCTGYADAERAAVIGGSHGGFLTGHLMGQHPDRFRCGLCCVYIRHVVADMA